MENLTTLFTFIKIKLKLYVYVGGTKRNSLSKRSFIFARETTCPL